jgi:nitrite reductase/ring-hydroxylating ferredoxin subunit
VQLAKAKDTERCPFCYLYSGEHFYFYVARIGGYFAFAAVCRFWDVDIGEAEAARNRDVSGVFAN